MAVVGGDGVSGRWSINRCGAGSMPAALKLRWKTCANCCASLPGAKPSRRRCQRDRGAIRFSVGILEFHPGAQPGIVDVRLVLPKIGFQPALNLQIVQLQLDGQNVLGKTTPDVVCTNIQSGYTTALVLRFDHHMCLWLLHRGTTPRKRFFQDVVHLRWLL